MKLLEPTKKTLPRKTPKNGCMLKKVTERKDMYLWTFYSQFQDSESPLLYGENAHLHASMFNVNNLPTIVYSDSFETYFFHSDILNYGSRMFSTG